MATTDLATRRLQRPRRTAALGTAGDDARKYAGLRRAVSPVLIVLAWQAASSTGVLDSDTLASPLAVVTTGWDLIQDGTLPAAIWASVRRVVSGFVIGAGLGVGLALVAGLSRLGEDALDPPLQMLRTLPHFGLIPLFILWMGIGEAPKVTLIAMGVLFPLYLNTFAGIRNVDRRLLEAARTFGLSRLSLIRNVILPGALPHALTGLRFSLGIAWLSLIVAETIAASSGLGWMINDAREFLQTDVIVVGLIVYSLLGLLTDALVRVLERKALAWR
jgi:sulfonate transport system permease protein